MTNQAVQGRREETRTPKVLPYEAVIRGPRLLSDHFAVMLVPLLEQS